MELELEHSAPELLPMTRSLVKALKVSIGGNVENLDQHQLDQCRPLWLRKAGRA